MADEALTAGPTEEEPPASSRGRVSILLRLLGLTVLVSAWLMVVNLYDRETESHYSHFALDAVQAPSRVELDISLASFNPQRGDLVVRIRPTPQGACQEYNRLTEALVIATNVSTGRVESLFKKGDTMAGIEATISVDDGDPGDYPYDLYQTTLAILVAHPNADGSVDPVPAYVSMDTALDGYELAAEEVPSTVGALFINIRMKRSHSVRAFATFVIILMLLIALVSTWITFELIRDERRRVPEINVVQWLAALLFALPPLRNAMPGAPAIGSQCDYISFFWAEAAVAVCMLTLSVVWLTRRNAA